MLARPIFVSLVGAALALGLAACGGGGGGGSNLALGTETVVEHTFSVGTTATSGTVGITVLKVRKGSQQDLTDGGLKLDPEEKTTTPYYVDVRYENKGTKPFKRDLVIGLDDNDGNSISGTTIISFGGPPFEKCPPDREESELPPGEGYEDCALFLVPEGKEPDRIQFIPYNPEQETDFIYWAVE